MKEEALKKIIKKGSLETSNEFVDSLMNQIEVEQEVKKVPTWWSFKWVLVSCIVLTLILTFVLFKLLASFAIFSHIPKLPVFLCVTSLLLYYINTLVRVRELQ